MIKTFELLGEAYTAKQIEKGEVLTHACEVDNHGSPVKVVCGRVKLENICDDLAIATDEKPTCKNCQRKLAKQSLHPLCQPMSYKTPRGPS